MKKRNYGIDLLRIVSMFMVVILHVIGKGGALSGTQVLSANYEIAYFLETAAYCAVNCFAMISGFVGVDNKFKYTNIIKLWFQVEFLNITIMIPFLLFNNSQVTAEAIGKAIFPITTTAYWYFTAYFCMYFFIPFFNQLLNNLSKSQLNKLIFSAVFLFSLVPTLFEHDLFATKSGYSVLWLSVLYIIGGYIKKYRDSFKLSSLRSFLGYFICIAITWGVRFAIEAYTMSVNGKKSSGGILTSYTSPTILLAAVFLLLLFSNLKPGKISEKIIRFLAPLSFGVYIIHQHSQIKAVFIKGKFEFVGQLPWYQTALMILLIAAVIYILSSLIDEIRLLIFKVCKVDKLALRIENRIKRMVNMAFRMIKRMFGSRERVK